MVAQAALAADTPPGWLRKPTAEDLMGVWPQSAMERGLGGKAVISCVVTTQGALRDCLVRSETPAGGGFGSAAIALTPQLLMKPATRNGAPVESRVEIPVNFPKPNLPTGSHMPGGGSMAPAFVDRAISDVPWSQAPSVADVAAAYPEKARADGVSGRATLDCLLTRAGGLSGCTTLREEPKGYAFPGAARVLARKFVGPTTDRDGKSLAGVHAQVLFAFAFDTLSGSEPAIGRPQWTALPRPADMLAVFPPAAEKAGVRKARVVMKCRVAEGGALADCRVESEEPAGFGYGAATYALVPTFRLSVWTDEGLPTIGGTVRVPIRFDFTEGPPAKP
ncbi:MAG: TonB family protein [Phenylobacterium sp.]